MSGLATLAARTPASLIAPPSLHRSLFSHPDPAFHPLPVADGPPRQTPNEWPSASFLSWGFREPSLRPGQRTESLKHRNPRRVILFHPARQGPAASPAPALLSGGSRTPGPRDAGQRGIGKYSAVTWRWPSWLPAPGSSTATLASRPEDSEHQTAGPARAPGTPAPPRRVAPKYTCLCGFSLVPVSRA